MERWRSFFGNAGEDLWTIIEQAILLAAHDYPREFKEKRCLIAETLFAKHPHQGDADATRWSASVVTNCTTRMGAGETRGEDGHPHETEHHHEEFCSGGALDGRVGDRAPLLQVVCNIKETLKDSMQQSEAAVLHGLQMLESLHISVDVLKATEVGKQVNSLRKHPCQDVRGLAKSLVRHWKEVVDDWVNRAGTSHSSWQEGNAIFQTDHEEGTFMASHVATRLTRDTLQCGSYGDTKAQDNNCREVPEERGSSSRDELSAFGRIERPHFKSRDAGGMEVLLDDSNVVTGRVMGEKDSTAHLGIGRLAMSVRVGKGSDHSRSHGTAKLSTDFSRVSKVQGDSTNQKQKQSRPSSSNNQCYASNGEFLLKEKVEVWKRKPQVACMQQVDNAKRHQTTLAMNNLRDLSMAGGVHENSQHNTYSHPNHARK